MKRTPLNKVSKKKKAEEPMAARYRKAVHERDGYECQMCGKDLRDPTYSDERTVSHIWPVGSHPEWRFVLENAFSACGGCHWYFEHDLEARETWMERFNYERLKEEFNRGVGTIIK
jgi:5-methylcytosine-specific restriction endonuclease McrA